MPLLATAPVAWVRSQARRLRGMFCRHHRPASTLTVYVLGPWERCVVRLGGREGPTLARSICRKRVCHRCGHVWLSPARELTSTPWRRSKR